MTHREPIPPRELGCHRTGFSQKCRHLVTEGICDRWRHHPVMTPQGETFEAFDCVDNWSAQYASDTVQQVAQLGSAVESFRNQVLALVKMPNGVPGALPPRGPYNRLEEDQVSNGHLLEDQRDQEN